MTKWPMPIGSTSSRTSACQARFASSAAGSSNGDPQSGGRRTRGERGGQATATRGGDEIANALHELRETAPAAPAQADAPQQRTEPADRAESRNERDESRNDSGDRNGASEDTESGERDSGERRQRNRDGSRQNTGNQNGAQTNGGQNGSSNQNNGGQNNGGQRDGGQNNGGQSTQNRQSNGGGNQNNAYDDDEAGGSRRSRRRRSRDRQNRRTTPGRGGNAGMDRYENEPTVGEDDVLVPTRGILDVMDNYAFVRVAGYMPSPDDAYVALSMVKKFGLRKGDVVTGELRQSKEGDSKAKFNPLIKLDTVNGGDPEAARNRPEFAKLTPLYPQERLKLETTSTQLVTRIIDLMAPIGKGQRALIVSPPKAGKTMMMQAIANAIAANNPEVHLMVVLVDERPEEVTDFQRTVKGEVIASTFDRPAGDHTTVAELAIERAKRLVEAGKDVVVLLDGITRLSRAYNLAAPPSGRILSGGVDSAALYPPKRFLGAARNIEGGGSLTILATALVETGSKMDEVIFEEFKGTGNSEIRLRRDFAEKRIFPAIDVDASSTRREELLMSREELNIVWKLRRVIGGLDSLQGLETLLDRLKKTESNRDFMVAITKSMPA